MSPPTSAVTTTFSNQSEWYFTLVLTNGYLHATDQMEEQSLDLMNRMYGCNPNGDTPNDGAPVRLRLVR